MLMRIPKGHKSCTGCGETKPTSEFFKEHRTGRPRSQCKACCRVAGQKYYADNRERFVEWAHVHYVQNRSMYHGAVSRRRARRKASMVDEHVDIAWLRARDGDQCHYCGAEMRFDDGRAYPNSAQIEHKTPLSRGGMHSESNCVAACRKCNRAKGAKTAEEFRASL